MDQSADKFKLVLMGAFIFFILVGLVAFSTYKASSPTSSNVIVNVWGTIDKITFDSFIEKYKQNSNLQFQLNYSYFAPEKIDNQLVEAIATGKAPDAIVIPQTLIKRYLDKIYPLTSIPERTFRDTFVQEAELYLQPNGIFGLPFFVDPLIMYWNKDMYSSAGIAIPPIKWTEFPLLAEKISQTDNSANIKKSAVAFGEFTNINNAKPLLSTLIMQAGSQIVSFDGNRYTSTLDSKSISDISIPAVSAIQFFTDYSNPKKVVYSWNKSVPSSKLAFLGEDLATYFGFASEYKDIKEKNPNLNFDIALMPQIVDAKAKITFGELYGFAFLKSSPNIASAYNLLSLLVSADAVTVLTEYLDIAPARKDLIMAGTKDPIKSIFFNSALISRAWLDPNTWQTDRIFQDMIENITTGKTSIQDSVSKASLELDNIL